MIGIVHGDMVRGSLHDRVHDIKVCEGKQLNANTIKMFVSHSIIRQLYILYNTSSRLRSWIISNIRMSSHCVWDEVTVFGVAASYHIGSGSIRSIRSQSVAVTVSVRVRCVIWMMAYRLTYRLTEHSLKYMSIISKKYKILICLTWS